jgi:branched-subunit amino acid aminotransferase/4-amino-4-deoxychorismate lyase
MSPSREGTDKMYAILNGELIDEKDAVVPVTRRELFFNFSIYESLKVTRSKALFVNEHVERFMESARILGMEHPHTFRKILDSIILLIRMNEAEEATVRLQMIGGNPPLLFIFLSPLPEYRPEWYIRGVSAISYIGERIFPKAKSNCLLLNYIAYREATAAGALDALLIDRNGHVTEGTRSNFFAFQDNTLVTAGEDILLGVTRKLILEAAEALGMDIRFEKISLKELLENRYDEPFISSTSMGAMPLREIDGIATGTSFLRVGAINNAVRKCETLEIERIVSLYRK